jgi:DNA-binding transcriptional ArsR family regulator
LRKTANAHDLFAALGDETRLRLVSRLSSGPSSIAGLTEGEKMTRQAITKHLRVLEGAGLVKTTKRGRENVIELTPQRLDDARHYLDLIERQWESALGRLKKFVED